MTRRRLTLAACVAVVALGAAWWLASSRLSLEEQKLAGTWHLAVSSANGPTGVTIVWALYPDHAYRVHAFDEDAGAAEREPDGREMEVRGRWWVQGGAVIFERGGGIWTQLRRLLSNSLPWSLRGAYLETLQIDAITNEELVVRDSDGMVLHFRPAPN
jgi:hypothetical protein